MRMGLFLALLGFISYLIVGNPNHQLNQYERNFSKPNKEIEGSKHLETIVLGAGCFWGVEKRYQNLPGVVDAVSGYADGEVDATYREITKRKHRFNPKNHAEVVRVTFNKNEVDLETILHKFYEMHDPTQRDRQGNDVGTQYRSTILYSSKSQKALAEAVTATYQELLSKAGYGKIQTKIRKLERFHSAEKYHQDYLFKNPNGYCPDHSTGVVFNKTEKDEAPVDNSAIKQGKQIVVIDARNFCPYCEKFKKQVAEGYRGEIPLTFRYADQLEGLSIKTPTWATPTILFLKDGKEVFGHQGLLSKKDFYRVLGIFILDKEAYDVAFNKGTDSRFCKQYDIFKNTPDGVFVDALSGAPLFDTRDRFNSGTGWLSFTKPVAGSVYEKPDHSFGMKRTEILSKSTGIHLGHVFDDGPRGQNRYCINATVLKFLPRDEWVASNKTRTVVKDYHGRASRSQVNEE